MLVVGAVAQAAGETQPYCGTTIMPPISTQFMLPGRVVGRIHASLVIAVISR